MRPPRERPPWPARLIPSRNCSTGAPVPRQRQGRRLQGRQGQRRQCRPRQERLPGRPRAALRLQGPGLPGAHRGEGQREDRAGHGGLPEGAHRQPRRDRSARHPRLQGDGPADHRGVLDRRQELAPCPRERAPGALLGAVRLQPPVPCMPRSIAAARAPWAAPGAPASGTFARPSPAGRRTHLHATEAAAGQRRRLSGDPGAARRGRIPRSWPSGAPGGPRR
jgi:hypothetical protein